jgi:hypothetical protein
LDELTWVQREDVWAVAPQIVLDKIAGFTKFSDETLVIAAGNRPEDASTIVRLIHNPLLNRFKIIKVSAPTPDEWAQWMNSTYGDNWDKRTYAFLKRFQDEGYLLKIPNSPEGLEEFPTPRSWTWLALDLKEGFDSLEDICGLIGEEVGRKFDGFLKVNVDVEELIADPQRFHKLELDGKYMVPLMLASWITEHAKDQAKAYPLIDEMSSESREFLVMLCMSMNRKSLVSFLRQLFTHRPAYKDALAEIAINIKEAITPS